jgi:hypothetical protein
MQFSVVFNLFNNCWNKIHKNKKSQKFLDMGKIEKGELCFEKLSCTQLKWKINASIIKI